MGTKEIIESEFGLTVHNIIVKNTVFAAIKKSKATN